MRILVAIANYGIKNTEYVIRLLQEYRSMPFDARIFILSEAPKNYGDDVTVLVGLPTKDPWSLPFGHKKLFADNIDKYDLFIYSEDDILLTRRNIEAFVMASGALPEDTIAGFVRFELDSDGKKWYPDFVGPYHWLPNSVEKVDGHTFAAFSNAHSACYMMTRDQLRRAIMSKKYLVGPHKGRYDMLCSAATDPYTQCGFQKLICISLKSDFTVHHLPNTYVNVYGIDERDFEKQIGVLFKCGDNLKLRKELFPVTKRIDHIRWDKMYYGRCDEILLSLIDPVARRVLSIGSGYASSEELLVRKGIDVTVIPLDPIIGAVAQSKGIRVIEGDLGSAFREIQDRKFDCILLSDVLQHVKDPLEMLKRSRSHLVKGGEFIIGVPNFKCLKFFKDYFPYPILKKWTYEKNLIHVLSKTMIKKWFGLCNVRLAKIEYSSEYSHMSNLILSLPIFRAFLAHKIYAVGKA